MLYQKLLQVLHSLFGMFILMQLYYFTVTAVIVKQLLEIFDNTDPSSMRDVMSHINPVDKIALLEFP